MPSAEPEWGNTGGAVDAARQAQQMVSAFASVAAGIISRAADQPIELPVGTHGFCVIARVLFDYPGRIVVIDRHRQLEQASTLPDEVAPARRTFPVKFPSHCAKGIWLQNFRLIRWQISRALPGTIFGSNCASQAAIERRERQQQ